VSLIVLAAGKGAPGVSTAATVLAGVWPRAALLAECDPAGGDLLFRLPVEDGAPLAVGRGIISLATACRTGAPPQVMAHAQQAAGGLPVLFGPAHPGQAGAIAGCWPMLATAFSDLAGVDVLADCGRLEPQPTIGPLLAAAGLVVLVCRAEAAGVWHTRHAIELLRRQSPALAAAGDGRLVALPVGEPRAAADAASALHGWAPVCGRLARDRAGAGGVGGGRSRRLQRSPLVVSARTTAHVLDERLARLAGSDGPAGRMPAPPAGAALGMGVGR